MSAWRDVIVVGGGPAGSACARELVRAGADVAVVDRAVFPRDKTCAGWITPEAVATLDLDLNEYARGRTLQPVHGFDVGVIGGRRTVVRFDGVVSYAIRRCEFDTYLLERSGAPTCQGVGVRSIQRLADGWRIDPIGSARMLVGAGGHFCPVARLLNPPAAHAPSPHAGASPRAATFVRPDVDARHDGEGDDATVVAAQELEVPLNPADDCPVLEDVPELYFCRDLRGYGWCVRKGDYLNVGFGRLDPRGVPAAARAFLDEMQRLGRVPRSFPSRWLGHAYRVYAWSGRRLHADRVVLAGDAAGLAFPVSGEGILPAIVSGQLAARSIVAAAPAFTADVLGDYVRQLATRLGPPGGSTLPLPHLPAAWIEWAGRRAMESPWFVRRVVVPRFLHTDRHALPAAA